MKNYFYVTFLVLNFFAADVFSQAEKKQFTSDGRLINTTFYGSHAVKKKSVNPKNKTHKLSFGNSSVNTALSITMGSNDASCYSFNNGTANAVVSGGTPPYQYYWIQTGETTSSIANLYAGTYQVIVLDSLCAMDTASVTVAEPPSLLISVVGIAPTCNNCDGSATVNPSGAGPYTYLWSGGQTTDSVGNLCGGLYNGSISDLSGCTENFVVSITATIDSLDFYYDGLCELDSFRFYPTYVFPYSLFTDYTGCYTPSTWSWDFGDIASGINNTSAIEQPVHFFTSTGSYTVTLVVNGTDSVVKVINVVNPTANFLSFTDCQNPPSVSFVDISICATSYLWNFGDPSTGTANVDTLPFPIHTFSGPGIFSVQLIINPLTGNADTLTLAMNLNAPPTVNLGSDTIMMIGDSVSLNAGPGGYSYSWNTGDTTNSIMIHTTGLYSVFISDSLFCSASDDKLVLYCSPTILSVPNAVAETKVSLYPSPAKEEVTLETKNVPANSILSFYDISGRELKQMKITDARTTISCANFAGGIYFYKLTDNKKIISAGKFVKE